MKRKIVKKIPDEEYVKILRYMPVCCVDLVIHHKGKVLLVYRRRDPAKNKWWLPGGRIYKNEKFEEAAYRKAIEETGLKIKIKKKLGSYDYFDKKSSFKQIKNGVHTPVIGFLVETVKENQPIKIDSTSSDYKWIDRIEEELHPYVKKVLKDSGVLD